MATSQYVVTSEVHGDVAGFSDRAMARALAHRLNTSLFDAVVYLPLEKLNFEVTSQQEAALNQQYIAEEFNVVLVLEE